MGERALWPPDRLSLMISVGLAMLAIPALAQPRPKPVGKVVGPCPIGYRYATGSCTPLNRWSRVAFVKKGPCPIGWSHSGAYCTTNQPMLGKPNRVGDDHDAAWARILLHAAISL